MDLTADLTGASVLVTGNAVAARRAVRRYRAAGAVVSTIECPAHFRTSAMDEVLLVAAVDDGDPGWEPLRTACRLHGVFMVSEPAALPGRHVTLVGGGPGPVDLLTERAKEALREADVVYYDRLGPVEGLTQLAPGALLVDVGKTPGHHKIPQHEIEAMLVSTARSGARVVRLKGGDPYVFGRGGEELAACAAAGVPVSVVPGISSSIAVPGAAGIPVTHRGISRMFTVVSGHAPLSDSELEHLAGLGGTIVVLMGVGTLRDTAAGLERAGMRADMPAAVIERGFRPGQRTTIATLGTLPAAAALASNPAVLVIGEVVSLAGTPEQALLDSLASTLETS
ncbi:uroporphyrinogen-III C-methyltransferase [Arthrobacter sp. 35W]|uniref:uroporphyrinogen-III C-methyltransferase n=1 Tax=Arthrobacter sp. 35W TaxID=1132441 RepID=UPI0003FCF9F0|nr:uroporphyrinogen-III C-methyltransferase [Arthrobacter sp. 35W]